MGFANEFRRRYSFRSFCLAAEEPYSTLVHIEVLLDTRTALQAVLEAQFRPPVHRPSFVHGKASTERNIPGQVSCLGLDACYDGGITF